MKYALIGCGRIAVNHVRAAVNNGLKLAAVCDVVIENAEALFHKAEYAGGEAVERFTDYKEMIRRHPDLDLVSIATPSGSHGEIALYCIDHGIHVIIEKPMAMNMKDAEEIIRRSREKQVKVSVCHQNRFNGAVQRTRKALEEGRFGKLSHGSIHVRWNRNREYYQQAPWRGTWAEDGGCLMNQCIHGIDLLIWMMGNEADTVYGVTRRRQHPYLEAEDVGMAVVTFRNGAVATIEGTTNVYPRNLEETLCLFGEKGTVKVSGTSVNNLDVWDFEGETEEDLGSKGFEEYVSNVYGNGHTGLFADMVNAIRQGRKPYVDGSAGRDALEIVLAIYKSMKTGLPVKLPLEDFGSADMAGIFDD